MAVRSMLILALLGVAGCTPTDLEQADPDEVVQGPLAQESWDVNLQISEEGVIRLELDAAYMLRYDDPDSLYTLFDRGATAEDRVTATFFDSLGTQNGTLSAESVRFDEVDHTMIATGDVVLSSVEGRTLESEELHWDKDSRSIGAPGFVSLTTEDQQIRGYELVADEDLGTWSIERPTGTVTIRESN